MRRFVRCPWLALAAVTLTWVLPARPSASTFSSSCDRFEIDGNEFGSADGTFDFVDQFDNGMLGPEWEILLGSATETGGTAIVRNPGLTIQLGATNFEISTIENALHEISQAAGSFTARSHWLPTLPTVDTEFHMQLYGIGTIIEAAGLTVNNLSPAVAAQQGAGSLPGYSISQTLTHDFGPGFTTIQSDVVAIAPASVTGQIVLEMTLDGASDLLTCAFSLDGGATFQTPFPPMHVFNGVTDYDLLLGAAALAGNGAPPPPSPERLVALKLFEVKNPAGPTARRLRFNSKAPNQAPIPLANLPAVGATLTVLLDGMGQCFHMPAGALWSVRSGGAGASYRDSSGLYGPIRAASIRRSSRGVVKSKAVAEGKLGSIDVVPPDPGLQADLRLHLGDTDLCMSTAGGDVAKNDARVFKVKNAPAPGACAIPACSPSGAFLD